MFKTYFVAKELRDVCGGRGKLGRPERSEGHAQKIKNHLRLKMSFYIISPVHYQFK